VVRLEPRRAASGQWVVELEAGWLALELECERREWRGELALPGMERMEPRAVASDQWVVDLKVGWLVLELE
jgi:hypothetical protein